MNDPENDYNVRDLSIEELIPNTFENCIVTIFEDHHTLDMPVTMTGMVFSNWLKTKAGVFSRDVNRFTHKKPHGKYVFYEGYGKKYVARLINEDELLLFESLNLVDGRLKDVPFMILKNINEEETFTNIKRYIDISPDDIQDDVVTTHDPLCEDEETTTYNSVSLFSD